jgi:glutathione S-transferase
MYTLHIANKNYSSWSLRPWALLKARGIPFREQLHRFKPGGNYAEVRGFSPTGKVPCLVDGDTVVWDSLAIAEYVAERHPGAWPADPAARAFGRSAAAEMHSGFQALRNECSMSIGHRVQLRSPSAALGADVARLDALWSEGLRRFGGPFLVGAEFTAADAFFAPVAFRAQTYGLQFSTAASAYLARLLAHPALQDWQRAAVAEDFRDVGHDEEIAAAGVITADLRAPARGEGGP